jgi:ubiquinone/menaquinone biosynthesis C-methylase UbiE
MFCACNAAAEGVRDRVELVDADARDLPFASAPFDLVVSSLAISNVREAGGRAQALREAVRVLRPCGRLLIVDDSPHCYAAVLRDAGCTDVAVRQLHRQTWYGVPRHCFPWSQPPGHPADPRQPWPVRAHADLPPAQASLFAGASAPTRS